MAKNPSTTATTTDETPAVETTVDETVETPAEGTETEAVVEEKPIDLTAFTAKVDEAVTNADESTGTVPDAFVAGVRTEYQALDGIKAKNAGKALLQERMKAYLKDRNAVAAGAIMQLTEQAAVAGKSGGSTPAKVVDPSEAYIDSLATLTLGLYLVQRHTPEGVDGDAARAAAVERANAAFEDALKVSESEDQATDNALIKGALKVAAQKVRKSSGPRVASGDRRDLGAHIEEAFAAAEVGAFLTVADIRKFESTGYGKDHPSAGAITNRLEPKSGKPTTIPGIKVERRDNKLGAVKVEVPASA